MTLVREGPLEGEFRWRFVADGRSAGQLSAELTAALCEVAEGPVQIWVRDVDAALDAAVSATGARPYRDLWQLRCALPAAPTDLDVRAFTPDDADGFLEVNNRAFHWHPEQGAMTRADLTARQAEEWFDPEGFLIHERSGRIAGFCWTKGHPDEDPPLGEIYVIAVDPDFAGGGLGTALTLAGLAHLSSRGLETGMLYVESDNEPANRTYERIGFRRHRTDRAYRFDPARR